MAGLVPAIHEFALNEFVGRIKATCDWLIVVIESFGLIFFKNEDLSMTSILHSVVEPEIDLNNIWQDDLLDRKKLSDTLLELTSRGDGNISLQLESSYGSGKTFFLKRFAQEAKNAGHVVIQYDAWENDLLDDPIPSFCVSLLSQLNVAKPFRDVKKEFDGFQKALIPIVAKISTGFLSRLVFNDADFLDKAINETLEKEVSDQSKKYIEDYNKSLGRIKLIKSEFEKIASLPEINNNKIRG